MIDVNEKNKKVKMRDVDKFLMKEFLLDKF